jgi:hypothetical protein
MRRTQTLAKAGLVAATALFALTACGGEESDSAVSTTPSATSTSADPSTPSATADAGSDPEAQAFCTEAEAVTNEVGTVLTQASSDPAAIPGALEQAVAAFQAVDAPAAVATQWDALTGAIDKLRTDLGTLDLTSPEAQTTAQTAFTEFQSTTTEPAAGIEEYCGPYISSSASPTS